MEITIFNVSYARPNIQQNKLLRYIVFDCGIRLLRCLHCLTCHIEYIGKLRDLRTLPRVS